MVCFSGGKLLGGPQAGIIIGKKKIYRYDEKEPGLPVLLELTNLQQQHGNWYFRNICLRKAIQNIPYLR